MVLHDAVDRDGDAGATAIWNSPEGNIHLVCANRLLGTEDVSGQYLSTGREIILDGPGVSTTNPSAGYCLAAGTRRGAPMTNVHL